jgi:hypothetical protein
MSTPSSDWRIRELTKAALQDRLPHDKDLAADQTECAGQCLAFRFTIGDDVLGYAPHQARSTTTPGRLRNSCYYDNSPLSEVVAQHGEIWIILFGGSVVRGVMLRISVHRWSVLVYPEVYPSS